MDDDQPSDYSDTDLAPTEKELYVDTDEDDAVIRDELKRELLLLSSITNRGAHASREEMDILVDIITQLEALNPTADPANLGICSGDWDLCLSNTQAFRSSPFFQSVRWALGEENKDMAENVFDLHEKATSVGKVARVRQKISTDGELVSEVDLEVGLMGGMPFRVKGTVVTEAAVTATGPELWEMRVKNTKVKGSNVPFLDQLLDDYPLEVPFEDIFNTVSSGLASVGAGPTDGSSNAVPVALLKTFYVDESIRITRDIDDNFYVFTRA